MEDHKRGLNKHCRVCAKSMHKFKCKRRCSDYRDLLIEAYSIDCVNDDPEVHPAQFCPPCFQRAGRISDAKAKGAMYESSVTPFVWTSHSGNSCDMCEMFSQQSVGGRPRKERKNRGHPGNKSTHTVWKHLNTIAPASFQAVQPLYPSRFHTAASNISLADFQCPSCANILNRPIQLTMCGKMICMDCFVAHIKGGSGVCPGCSSDHEHGIDNVQSPPEVVVKLIGGLYIRCESPACQQYVQLQNLADHLASGCRQHLHLPLDPTVGQLLSQSPHTPTTAIERRVATSLVKRMLAESPEENIVELVTGGQPLTLERITKGRITTEKACRKTVRRRCKEMSIVRDVVSAGSSTSQLKEEVQSLSHLLSHDEWKELFGEHKFGMVDIPPEKGLAIKADLNLPWNKLRLLKRWLKDSGVTIGSERKMRRVAQAVVGTNLASEALPFSFPLKRGGEEMRPAALCYVPDLGQKVFQLLDQNERNNRLTWHDGMIPEDEIWVKIGGDKGGGSFKMSFQICNVPHPNSVENTCVFAAFQASDSAINLHIALDRYKDQVNDLNGTKWRRQSDNTVKTVHVIVFGDYEVLAHLYGLSGASGRHCCLWCEVESKNLKLPLNAQGPSPENPNRRKPSPSRSLETLRRDYENFLTQGKGDLKKAKEYNNVIGPYFFDIPLDQVCPPGLHISLGIFQRLFDLLEADCHSLDLAYAESCQAGSSTSFQTYSNSLQDLGTLSKEAETMSMQVTWLEQTRSCMLLTSEDPESSGPLRIVTEELARVKSRQQDIDSRIIQLRDFCNKGFEMSEGPFVRSLDKALGAMNVHRQAYYGGTFIGNHVHKCLKPENVHALCTAPLIFAQQSCPALTATAHSICKKHEKVMALFSDCHQMYNSAEEMTSADADVLGAAIAKFLLSYRSTFTQATILPKMHFLEDHAVPWIKKWRTGFGFLGEQGGESIHKQFNALERSYNCIPNKVERLHHIMEAHHTQVCPELEERPQGPARKKKEIIKTCLVPGL